MVKEHDQIFDQVNKLSQLANKLSNSGEKNIKIILKAINHLTQKLLSIKSHHSREEEILFPMMIKYGASISTSNMLKEHEMIRELKLELQFKTEVKSKLFPDTILAIQKNMHELYSVIFCHVHHEHSKVFPKALKIIKDRNDWKKMKEQSDKIGYDLFDFNPSNLMPNFIIIP